MSTVKIYGIKACDTMKKALTWLESHDIDFEFHDYKKTPIDEQSLEDWLSQVPWDELINKRGTTWRKLSDEDKSDIDNAKAIRLIQSNNSMIKRPVLKIDNQIHLGFKADSYAHLFETND
ncbi:arsenate reductase [Oleiphilus sp. HI0081]|uniref:ArsC family reductase n=4 Tax=Oleiphilus TaxID=141450 RepID=UPI0007C27049|nr:MULTISPECIES: ArsC family reductase [unclassified Oleiphilus]KZY77058.1 arsenate reductase [Oleiphilus sp. HI0068]KZY85863.1 arsenate reductase [Oleiphilus sp. HI0069]KZY88732.1 arsenate reductase [Oleiphilus sp. HI0072]KZZ13987.1 arsenate reductase [Oleiphilus sp. HI0078]KZZ20044.1 arsenate reductase [Oleiphilus sp. HI0081]KZZ33296.1 arsenate reductase [Oleiphilus sp. HI0085]